MSTWSELEAGLSNHAPGVALEISQIPATHELELHMRPELGTRQAHIAQDMLMREPDAGAVVQARALQLLREIQREAFERLGLQPLIDDARKEEREAARQATLGTLRGLRLGLRTTLAALGVEATTRHSIDGLMVETIEEVERGGNER